MKSNYYSCECKCGAIYVDYDPTWGLEIALLQRDVKRSWWNRLRVAWSALRGRPYTDMVILNDDQIANLVDYLVDIQNIENYNKTTTVYKIVNNLHEYDSKQTIDAILEYLKQKKSNTHIKRLISEIKPLKY